MKTLFRSLKSLPLTVAITLATHPALAQGFNLGSGRLGGGKDDVFSKLTDALNSFSTGAQAVGLSVIALSIVVLGIKIVWNQHIQWAAFGVVFVGASLITLAGYFAAFFDL